MNGSASEQPTNPLDGEQPEHTEGQSKRLFSEAWDWIKSILLAFIIVLFIHQFVFNLSTVKGHSMEPTLLEGEWLFINNINYVIGKPKAGDVAILKDPSESMGFRQYLVKRVVGLPGDRIEVRNRTLYINGAQADESYVDIDIEDGDFGPMTVPSGHYFVMGDNRHHNQSKDSRSFGAVPKKLIKGKAEFIVWPVTNWQGL